MIVSLPGERRGWLEAPRSLAAAAADAARRGRGHSIYVSADFAAPVDLKTDSRSLREDQKPPALVARLALRPAPRNPLCAGPCITGAARGGRSSEKEAPGVGEKKGSVHNMI